MIQLQEVNKYFGDLHVLNNVSLEVADRVVFMADGMIMEEGTPEQFFGNSPNERLKSFLSKIL